MIRKILLFLSSLFGLFFLLLGIYRTRLPYDESGNYFDGLVNYHIQSAEVYIGLSIICMILAGIIILIGRGSNR